MFTAFSSGLTGLVKVAQDKMGTVSENPQPQVPEVLPEKESKEESLELTKNESEATKNGSIEDTKQEGNKENLSEASSNADVFGAAKEWGSYLFGGVKEVTTKVTSGAANATEALSSGAQMLKKTVEDNTILGEFNREQEKFMEDKKETEASQDAALPPWMGYAEDEENLKEQILALSSDERHFTRPPPGGVSYTFDYQTSYPIALATLEADPMLQEMRFKLVPKKIKEEEFWKNYFYRVSLIKQSVALTSMSEESNDPVVDEAELVNVNESPKESSPATEPLEPSPDLIDIQEEESIPEWEKELQRELQEYEVVQGEEGGNIVEGDLNDIEEASAEWQEEIQRMLEQADD